MNGSRRIAANVGKHVLHVPMLQCQSRAWKFAGILEVQIFTRLHVVQVE